MSRKIVVALFVFPILLGACQSEGGAPSLNTEDQKASYGIGIQIGSQLAPTDSFMDMDAFLAGLKDGMAGNDPAIPPEELQTASQAFNQKVMEEQNRMMAEAAEKNALEGAAFLTENAARDGVVVTESGLQYEVLREGEGERPGPDQSVSIHYVGTLVDGTQFDSSYDRGEPATFGVSGVIQGFSEGLQLMAVGSQYKFFIPSEIGYGPGGQGQIGPNSTLIFEVELLEIVP
ncbi:MAG: FKBP-type peptidyl-prolyl cis-trans isomerase [Gemmatimonadetes bacterium]|nr:FKBP-type peptidyl-prolyl cis-trans isomerase [Gemmatimonadota bacterium]NNM05431.1 FKBP-type peptidyl-prolyl cis-trans isomerase [Gemmatimonadota bacterium]